MLVVKQVVNDTSATLSAVSDNYLSMPMQLHVYYTCTFYLVRSRSKPQTPVACHLVCQQLMNLSPLPEV